METSKDRTLALGRWLEPFFARLTTPSGAACARLYIAGLIVLVLDDFALSKKGPVPVDVSHDREEVWLIGNHHSTGGRRHYLSDLPADTALEALAGLVKAHGG